MAASINVNSVLQSEGDKLTPKRINMLIKIGSPFVIAGMKELVSKDPDAKVVGYEANGGFLVGTNIQVSGKTLHALPTRDSMLPMLIILAMSVQQARTVSQLSSEFAKRYTVSDRIRNIPTETSRQLISELKASKKTRQAVCCNR
ncbi:hypothetical protein [Marinomonas pollencensis]|uniref:Phosphoglucomutase/phosphomannomutase-like protein n=1 Tax=Marinomonas pollencensis TaxID=491954 RepID=A0A3E0DA07_9GAMM|nr:hypothetical protein [Marinomonas pollencensis]REG79510.1 phosphoglucomutase/phosphomannomutase-like protein [Marinomonas pollencensis]